ncbi:MAG TPA: hypothetical protein VGT41_03980 [Candidatus Babeliales bacterium]|nr:hypothetical protein [Candidatus Babeliales bacterium]
MRLYVFLVGFFLSGGLHAARANEDDDRRPAQVYERLYKRAFNLVHELCLPAPYAFLPFTFPFYSKGIKLQYGGKDLLKRDLVVKKDPVQFLRDLIAYLKTRRVGSEDIAQKQWSLGFLYAASQDFYKQNLEVKPGEYNTSYIIEILEKMTDTSNNPGDFTLHAVISEKADDCGEQSAAAQSAEARQERQEDRKESEAELSDSDSDNNGGARDLGPIARLAIELNARHLAACAAVLAAESAVQEPRSFMQLNHDEAHHGKEAAVDNNGDESDPTLSLKDHCTSWGYAARANITRLAIPSAIAYLSKQVDNRVLRRTGYFFASISGLFAARRIHENYKEKIENLLRLAREARPLNHAQQESLLALSVGGDRRGAAYQRGLQRLSPRRN